MRKDLRRVVEEDLHEALARLGYSRIRADGSEWRRLRFHLFTRKGQGSKRKQILTLSMHEDMPCSLPPFHRARHKGKSITRELHKIVEAYQRRRIQK